MGLDGIGFLTSLSDSKCRKEFHLSFMSAQEQLRLPKIAATRHVIASDLSHTECVVSVLLSQRKLI